ncbi:uncharacterized protein LOC135842357 [Planococcus citri]|uniref:uncharacterized protein LOC135842357 n=1 Tax=Planococcus citri TaxID=170843 RepID=UPI0031F9FC42
MLVLLFWISFLLGTTHVESDANLDYFIMNEAHIAERRVNEDANAGHAPFYVACRTGSDSICEPATPIMNSDEGYVGFEPTQSSTDLYYGCLLNIGKKRVFNGVYIDQALLLAKAKPVTIYRWNWCEHHYETYQQRCRKEISPKLWRTSNELFAVRSYNIGFEIIGFGKIILAEVHFNHAKKIPVRTKHFVHGVSLAVPIEAYKTIEELVYQEDSQISRVAQLRESLKTYWNFNDINSYERRQINEYLKSKGLSIIPENARIAMAHLIPEYDMADVSWVKVTRFAQTIAPMWEELYLAVWADVEEIIREVAFMNQRKLTVFSGTHGKLAFKEPSGNGREFLLKKYNDVPVFVPELIWKLVIDENYEVNEKKAIVIVLGNLTEELTNLKIFFKLKLPSCQNTCRDFQWDGIDRPNVSCCEVNEVKHLIEELPDIVHKENFVKFMSKYEPTD